MTPILPQQLILADEIRTDRRSLTNPVVLFPRARNETTSLAPRAEKHAIVCWIGSILWMIRGVRLGRD